MKKDDANEGTEGNAIRLLCQKTPGAKCFGRFRTHYSVLSAVTGSFFAAFFDGIRPPMSVRTTLSTMRMIAPVVGRMALTDVVPVR